MTREKENKYAGLASLLEELSELNDEKVKLIEDLWFESIDEVFFQYISPASAIATLSFWFKKSTVTQKDFFSSNAAVAAQIQFVDLYNKWLTLLQEQNGRRPPYLSSKPSTRQTSVSLLLVDLFRHPAQKLNADAEKVSATVRLLCFLSIRHYFKFTSRFQGQYKDLAIRVTGLVDFVKKLESGLADRKEEYFVRSFLDVIDLSRKLLTKDIDRDFFSRTLRETFGEMNGVSSGKEDDLSPVNNFIQVESTDLDVDSLESHVWLDKTAGDESSIDDHQQVNIVLPKQNLTKRSSNKPKLTKKAERLISLCNLASLTSLETLKPNFLDYQRKPENALQLPHLNYALKEKEKKRLIRKMLADLSDANVCRQAATILFEFLTCSSLERLTSFVVVSQFDNKYINAICIKSGTWRRKSLEFEKRFTPDENQKKWLHSHNEFLHLPVPVALVDFLKCEVRKLCVDEDTLVSGIPLYQILGLDDVDCIPKLNTYLNDIKFLIDYGFRQLTQKSMRYALYSHVVHAFDASMASLIFSSFEFSNTTTLYYLNVSEQKLQRIYSHTLGELGCDVPACVIQTHGHIGSRMCIDENIIANRIKFRTQDLKKMLGQRDVEPQHAIELHNEFTCYVTLAFAIASAHRQSAEYFFDYASIDEMKGYLFVCDKLHHGESPGRLIPLTRHLKALLHQYRLQLRVTAHALKRDYPGVAKLLYSLYQPERFGPDGDIPTLTKQPLLGLIVDGQWRPVSQNDISRFLGDDFSLPGNFTRHLSCSGLPDELSQYRQHILGHTNQWHHGMDNMTYSLSWLEDERIISGLDKMLEKLGFVHLKAQSLRGAFSLTRLPATSHYYPKGYLERQSDYEASYLFASKHFRALLKEPDSGEGFLNKVSHLPTSSPKTDSSADNQRTIQRLYDKWFQAYTSSGSADFVRRIIASDAPTKGFSLDTVEQSFYVERMQRYFLDYLAKDSQRKSSINMFLLSLALYQPRLIQALYSQGKRMTFSVKKYQSTLFIETGKPNVDYFCAPLNWLSSFILMNVGLREHYDVESHQAASAFKAWEKALIDEHGYGSSKYGTSKYASFKFNSLLNLSRFISDYGIFTQTRLSVFASKDTPLPGDYAPQDIGRLIKHSDGAMYLNEGTKSSSSRVVRRRRLLRPYENADVLTTYDDAKERKFMKMTLDAIKDINNRSDQTSVERVIVNLWAEFIGSKSKDLESLITDSNECSEFLVLWLFYGVKASRRPSNKKLSTKIQANSAHKYLDALYHYLQPYLGVTPFLTNDEVFFEELYTNVLKSYPSENKKTLFERIKNFHKEIDDYFVVDQPDWQLIKGSYDLKFKRKVGIARLFAISDYEKAKHYLTYWFTGAQCALGTPGIEHDMHLVAMALAYRAGLRKQEIRNLQTKHINKGLRLLTVTATHYYGTKSVNSSRRVDLSLLFDDEEWSALVRVIEHAHAMQGGYRSATLFGTGAMESRLMNIDVITNNIMNICRTLSGNFSIRFYDLRHSHINYCLLLVSSAFKDKRYITSLAHWARCAKSELEGFRNQFVKQLIGEQAEVGGIVLAGLSRRLGHSPLTERQYYIHVLNILDDVMVNSLINKQCRDSPFYDALRSDFGHDGVFRPRAEIRNKIKSASFVELKKQATIPFSNMPKLDLVLTSGYLFESTVTRLYQCLSACWENRNDISAQEKLIEQSGFSTSLWQSLFDHLQRTGYRGIYLPSVSEFLCAFDSEQVEVALRYFNTEHFQSLLESFKTLYVEQPDGLDKLLTFYTSIQCGDKLKVMELDREAAQRHLGLLNNLDVKFSRTSSPNKLKGRNTKFFSVELSSKGALRKSSNDKLNFLIALAKAVVKVLDEKK